MSSAVYILLFVTGSQVLLSANAAFTVTPSNYTITVAWSGITRPYTNVNITRGTTEVYPIDTSVDESHEITDLQPGTIYSIGVEGFRPNGDLEILLEATNYYTSPLQPDNLQVSSSGPNSVDLSWDQVTGNPSPLFYSVEYENPPGYPISDSSGASTTYKITSLSSGVTYTFKVYARFGTSYSVPAVTSATTAPLAPTNTSVTDKSTTELEVIWTPSGNSDQDSFKVTYNRVGLAPVIAPGCTSSPCTIDVSSQGSPGTRFVITVYAVSNGVESTGVTAYGNTKPEPPGDLTVSMATSSTLVLLSVIPTGSTIESTNIVISPTLPANNKNVAQEGSNYKITLSGLTAGGRYDIEFSTRSGQAESDKVRGTFFSKPPTPNAPSRQSATTDSLTVIWTQPTKGALDIYVIAIHGGESKNVTIAEEKEVTFSELVAGRTYTVKLQTVVGTGTAEVWSDAITKDMTIKPFPATGILLKARTSNSLTVTWNAPTVGQFGSFKASLSSLDGTEKTFPSGSTYETTFSSLTPGTEFTVEIITVSGDQNSVVTQAPFYTKPNGPSNLRQTAVDNVTITIAWDSPLLGSWDKYEVFITPDGGSETKSDVSKEALTKPFTGLQPATEYTIKLRTVVSTVAGIDQTLTVWTNPNPPKAIMFSSKTTSSVAIEWTPPDRGVDGYKFSVTKTEDTSPTAFGNPTLPSAMVTNLDPGATYNVRVTSLTNIGLSTASESVPLTSKVTMVPNEVVNFGVKDTGQEYIEVQWDNPANGFSSFELTIGSQNAIPVTRGINTHKFSGLGPGQSYTITIKTVSNTVESPGLSRTLQTKPSNVQDLNIGTVTSTSIPVSWAEPTNTVFTSYELRINPNDGGLLLPIGIIKSSNYFYTFNNLKPGRSYTISIYVKADESISSEVYKTVITKPLPVRNLVTSPGTVQTAAFQVQWNVDQTSQQDNFTVKYVQADGGNIVENRVTANQGLLYTYNIGNLGPGKTYTVEVYAIYINVNGDSVPYNQTTKPSPVATFTATGTGTTVDLTWEPNTQSVQGSYELNYRGQEQATSWTTAQTVTDTSATIDNLFPGDKYTFQIVAISNGQKSDTKDVQKVTNPLPPPGLTVEEVTINSIRAVWGYDNTKTYNTQYKIYQSLTTVSNPQIVRTTSVNSRTVTVTGLTSGGNYTIFVYAMTIGNIESINASSVKATVKPVINSVLSDVRDETTNTTVVVSYTESTIGVFDKYRISITVGSELKYRQKDKDDVRKEFFTKLSLVPGTQYPISAITISGAQESSDVTTNIVTKPNPPLISCKSFKDDLTVIMNKTYGGAHSFHVECVGLYCPQSAARVNVNQGQSSEHTFKYLKPFTDYNIKVKSEVVYEGDSKTSIEATRICRTSQSAPEAVESFTFGDIKPFEVTLYWNEPTVPNGLLTEYRLTYKGTKQDKPETEEIEILIKDADINEKTVTDLKAGYKYVFWIQARTVDYGDQRNISKTLPIEAPYKDIGTFSESKPEMVATGAHDWLDIRFVNPFSSKNGEITGYSIIVMSKLNQLDPLADVDATWRIASNQKPMGAYAAIYKCPNLFTVGNKCWGFVAPASRKKRDVGSDVSIRVGGDAECSLGVTDYCNGPLQPESSYYILLRAYTEDGLFADTPISDVFTTAPKPIPNFLIPTIVSILALLILAIVLLAVIVLWRKGKICKGDQSEEGYDFDYLDRPRSSRFSYCNPVNRKEFGSHVRLMAADCDFRFAEEFESLKPVGTDAPHKASEEDANRLKNRFTNILPYDHSRVKLLPTDDEDGSDYINANWMPGYSSKREFLVCQGPLPATRDDFWRMVWEHNAVGIVMLTGCVEKGKEKCDHYWPVDTEPMFYGDLQVVILNETKSPHWVITQFKISKGEQSRKLCHYHFIAWKDFGVPEEGPGILVRFVRLVRERLGFDKSPIVVHCSAGVGRSGTYIAVDNLMQRIKEHDSLDVLSTVYDMRRHRCFMVQTEQQYIFIHQCLLYVLEKREKELDIYDSTHENDGFDDEGIAEH